MEECDFWSSLEYRVCGELAGLGDNALRAYWCDGFVPGQYLIDGPKPCIHGHAWMATGPRRQERWAFELLLDRRFRSVEEIDWSTLLPPDDVTRWLTIDPSRKQLVIEPSAAVPDKGPCPPKDKLDRLDRPGGRA